MPADPTAATETTPGSPAGEKRPPLLELPAAAMTTVPALRAAMHASAIVWLAPGPPRLMLITCAWLGGNVPELFVRRAA